MSRKLQDIRDYVEHTLKDKAPQPVIEAMREEELVELIFRYNTSEKNAEKALEVLKNINYGKWGTKNGGNQTTIEPEKTNGDKWKL